jgi:hypothetical protein
VPSDRWSGHNSSSHDYEGVTDGTPLPLSIGTCSPAAAAAHDTHAYTSPCLGHSRGSRILSGKRKRKRDKEVSAGVDGFDGDGASDAEMCSGLSFSSSGNMLFRSSFGVPGGRGSTGSDGHAGGTHFAGPEGHVLFAELDSIRTPPSTPHSLMAGLGGTSSLTHSDASAASTGGMPRDLDLLQYTSSNRRQGAASSRFSSISSFSNPHLTPLSDAEMQPVGGNGELEWFDEVINYTTV